MKKIVSVFLIVSLLFNIATTTPMSEKGSLPLGAVKIACGTIVYLASLGLATGLHVKLFNSLESNDCQLLTLIPGYIDIYPNIKSYAIIIAATFSGLYLLDCGLKDLKK